MLVRDFTGTITFLVWFSENLVEGPRWDTGKADKELEKVITKNSIFVYEEGI